MSTFTKCQKVGETLPTSPHGLREAGNAAVEKNNFALASHMYTLGVDAATRELKRDVDGHVDNSRGSLLVANTKSGGELAKLLANRSFCHVRLGDPEAALEDANNSVACDPTWEKAHLRVLAAMEILQVSASAQLSACERALAACGLVNGGTSPLEMKLGRLKALSLAESKRAAQCQEMHAAPSTPTRAAATAAESRGCDPLAEAKRVSQDPSDPRHAMACSDLGAACAVGAHGATKDVVEAERLLSIGAQAGDFVASRNLGLLLLELNRPEEAAPHLRNAADGGDEDAKRVLVQLGAEAEAKAADARAQLETLAARGDVRAVRMLRELGLEA